MLKSSPLLSTPQASLRELPLTAPHGQKCRHQTSLTKVSTTKATALSASASAALLSIVLALGFSGCSIEQEPAEDHQIELSAAALKDEQALTPSEKFISACNKCVLGDTTVLPQLIKTYLSTYTASIDYPKDAFTYQHLETTQAFERCALKAKQDGDNSGFESLIVRPARIARVARYFYAVDNPTQGAYWLQRIINTQGESRGLEVAGRIFIQHPKTIAIGVRLLEQSARLENTNARNMLLGLMNPSSSYYQELTRNTLSDSIDGTEPKQNSNGHDKSQGSDDIDYDDMNNANPDFEDNSEYAEDENDNDEYDSDDVEQATAAALNRSTEQQKLNDRRSARNRTTAQENIKMLEAKTTAAKAAAAERAAAEATAAAQESSEVTPLEALDSNDFELNIPMGLYDKRQPLPHDANAHENKSLSAQETTPDSDSNPDDNVTEAYQQENQERMHELENKAEAAAQKVRERMAQRQTQQAQQQQQAATNQTEQNGQTPLATPNSETDASPITAPAPETMPPVESVTPPNESNMEPNTDHSPHEAQTEHRVTLPAAQAGLESTKSPTLNQSPEPQPSE